MYVYYIYFNVYIFLMYVINSLKDLCENIMIDELSI